MICTASCNHNGNIYAAAELNLSERRQCQNVPIFHIGVATVRGTEGAIAPRIQDWQSPKKLKAGRTYSICTFRAFAQWKTLNLSHQNSPFWYQKRKIKKTKKFSDEGHSPRKNLTNPAPCPPRQIPGYSYDISLPRKQFFLRYRMQHSVLALCYGTVIIIIVIIIIITMQPLWRQHYASCPSVCPSVPFGLVSQKIREIKTGINVPPCHE